MIAIFEFETPSITELVRIILATAFLIGVSTYTARQSAIHRRNSISNRRLELQLTTLDPYLESLPDDKRIQIKEAIVQNYFGKQHPGEKNKEPAE